MLPLSNWQDEHSRMHIKLVGIANGAAYLHSLAITHGDIKHVCIIANRIRLMLNQSDSSIF
jgi:hypothetical protein